MVLSVVQPGVAMAEKSPSKPVAIQLLDGHIRLDVDGELRELRAGDLAVLHPDVPHAIDVLEDTALLFTVAMTRSERPAHAVALCPGLAQRSDLLSQVVDQRFAVQVVLVEVRHGLVRGRGHELLLFPGRLGRAGGTSP